MTLDEFFVVN